MPNPLGARGDGDRGSGLDQTLRNRVANSVDRLLETFDVAQADPTPEKLDQLREDADHAMRAIGRVLLEAERLANRQD